MSDSQDTSEDATHNQTEHELDGVVTGTGHRWVLLGSVLGIIITVGFYGLWFALVWSGQPRPTNMDALAMGGVAAVVTWVFGKGIQQVRKGGGGA